MKRQNLNIEEPSLLIDAAVCDLVAAITYFSDEHFDSDWLNLTEEEVEFLTVNLIHELKRSLQGEILLIHLWRVRQKIDLS